LLDPLVRHEPTFEEIVCTLPVGVAREGLCHNAGRSGRDRSSHVDEPPSSLPVAEIGVTEFLQRPRPLCILVHAPRTLISAP
jgi:hypothetical protein